VSLYGQVCESLRSFCLCPSLSLCLFVPLLLRSSLSSLSLLPLLSVSVCLCHHFARNLPCAETELGYKGRTYREWQESDSRALRKYLFETSDWLSSGLKTSCKTGLMHWLHTCPEAVGVLHSCIATAAHVVANDGCYSGLGAAVISIAPEADAALCKGVSLSLSRRYSLSLSLSLSRCYSLSLSLLHLSFSHSLSSRCFSLEVAHSLLLLSPLLLFSLPLSPSVHDRVRARQCRRYRRDHTRSICGCGVGRERLGYQNVSSNRPGCKSSCSLLSL
jgi:hypothetical protein